MQNLASFSYQGAILSCVWWVECYLTAFESGREDRGRYSELCVGGSGEADGIQEFCGGRHVRQEDTGKFCVVEEEE